MSEMQKYQRRLIPVNIAVMIIALVAALSILCLPLLSVDLGKAKDAIAEMIDGAFVPADGENTESEYAPGADIAEGLANFNFSLRTADFAKMAFVDDPVMDISVAMAGILRDHTGTLLAASLIGMLPKTEGVEIDVGNIDYAALCQKINSLNDRNREEVIRSAAQQIVTEGGVAESYRESYIQSAEDLLNGLYDSTVEYAGSFSAEALICMTLGGSDNEAEGQTNATTYDRLIYNLLMNAGGAELLEMYKVVGMAALCAVAVPAAAWLALFVVALVRCFTKNKKYTMWYVKVSGFTPCLIFGVGILAVKSAVPQNVAALFGIFSTMTWVSGACYALLWLVSVFWAFPIKRQIRKLRKSGVGYGD